LPYSSPEEVRDLVLGVDATIAPDAILTEHIKAADKTIINTITVPVEEEPLRNVEGTVYATSYAPIADITADTTVDPSDVRVFSEEGDEKVNEVLPEWGIIILDQEKRDVFIDYYYYLRKPDWELVKHASQLLSAHKFYIREIALIPETFSLGVWRMRRGKVQELYREYVRTISLMSAKPLQTTTPDLVYFPPFPVVVEPPVVVLPTMRIRVLTYSFEGTSRSIPSTTTTKTILDRATPDASFIPTSINYEGRNLDPSVNLTVGVQAKMDSGKLIELDSLTLPPEEQKDATLLASYIAEKLPAEDLAEEIQLFGYYASTATKDGEAKLIKVTGYLFKLERDRHG